MTKPRTVIESITKLESKENSVTITCFREEDNKDFDHNLNQKVIGQVAQKKHKTLYALAEALLAIHRMNAVEIRNPLGHGVHLYKDYSEEVDGIDAETHDQSLEE